PGTSVLHTRARYLLFIPWLFSEGARLRPIGPPLLDWVDHQERRLIEAPGRIWGHWRRPDRTHRRRHPQAFAVFHLLACSPGVGDLETPGYCRAECGKVATNP